jgi:transposase
MIRSGRRPARTVVHARILLKADVNGSGCGDDRIAEALECSAGTAARVRKKFSAGGLDAALDRKKPTGRHYRKLDGAQEARLTAPACGAPPAGKARWTVTLLADRLVELGVVAAVSDETVRRTLKKPR